MDIYEAILQLKKEGRASALATIVESKGSSPQKAGAKMLVRDDATTMGTLGGGCIEAAVIQEAIDAMAEAAPRTVPYTLTEHHGGLVCGGSILVYVEPQLPDPRLVIVGAGHVGKALAALARFSGFRVTVVDDRPEFANSGNLPDANDILVRPPTDPFGSIKVDPHTFVVIATRGHLHDFDAVKAALKTDAGYIGLVGSRRKKAVLMRSLEAEGFGAVLRERVITPVGLTIGSVTPEEIAVSIMAQIIQKRRDHAGAGLCHPACGGSVAEDGTAERAAAHQ